MKTRLFLSCTRFVFFTGSCLWLPVAASAADFSVKPLLSVSEEVTDNIYEQAAPRRTEMITRVSPGANLHYLSPLWSWDSSYNFEFRNYARNSRGNEYNHNGTMKGNIALINNFLILDLNDSYRRVTVDVSRNAATESSLFLNQTDQNVAKISPYLLWRLWGDNTLKTGYRFTDTRYWGAGIEKSEHNAFADLNYVLTPRLSLTGGYAFTRLESLPMQYNKHDLSGGFKYEYAEKSFISGQIGNSWQQFDTGLNVNYLFWNAEIIHDFTFAVASLNTKVGVTEDPLAVSTKEISYNGRLERTLQRGFIGLSTSYSQYVNTVTDLTDRRKASLSATGRYEVFQDFTVNMTATGERFSRKTDADYPYRLTGVLGAGLALNHELTLGVTYTFVTNRYSLDSTNGSKDINKMVVEVKKGF